jgi:hypothetical protein
MNMKIKLWALGKAPAIPFFARDLERGAIQSGVEAQDVPDRSGSPFIEVWNDFLLLH